MSDDTVYLRDYIAANVTEDCGGDGTYVQASEIQTTLNELTARLDEIEAGIGYTVKLSQKVVVPFHELSDGSWVAVMPTSGTVTTINIYNGLEAESVAVACSSSSTTYTITMDEDELTQVYSLSLAVYTGDYLTLTPSGGYIGSASAMLKLSSETLSVSS